MARVFLSHAGEDIELAAKIHAWLRADGHEVFLDQDLRDGIVLGDEWEQRLFEQLRRADAVVFVLTSAYTRSVWCTAEVVFARSRGSRLLPVVGEPGIRHPLLSAVQYGDATEDEQATRAMLTEALVRVDAAGGGGWPDDRSPFPGLKAFDTDLNPVFFGREEDVRQLAALLRSPTEPVEGAAVLAVGPSGCGKSSLLRAGLLPVMADEAEWWALSPFLPGPDPVGALALEVSAAARLLGRSWPVADVRRQMEDGRLAQLVGELLLAVPGHRRRRLLIPVDQFEELFTQTPPRERARFAALLRPVLAGPVGLVATLRPEFLDPLLKDGDLSAVPRRIYTVQPLDRHALRAVVEKPARLAGIEVDDELVGRLVADTGSGEALPLLAYTLAELAAGIRRGGRLLTSRYEQLGGVQGALTRQAEAALGEAVGASGRNRHQVVRELLRLVTVDEDGRPTRARVQWDELPLELSAFVTRRLLTTDQEGDRVVVGVAHEAFLSAWQPLREAAEADKGALKARRAVERAANDWDAEGRPPTRLWERGRLAAALSDIGAHARRALRGRTADGDPPSRSSRWSRWPPIRHRTLVTDRIELEPLAREFLLASIRRDRWQRGRLAAILSALLVLALAGGGIALVQRNTAQQNERQAVARQLVAQADVARADDPRTALLLGIAAERLGPGPETRSSLVETLTHTAYTCTLQHPDDVVSVAQSRHGGPLATGDMDGVVRLWDVSDPAHPRQLGQPLTGHDSHVYSVEYSPDGRTLASASGDGTTVLWDVADPRRAHQLGAPLAGHAGQVHAAAFSADGHTLATGGFDGAVVFWDVSDPARPRLLGPPLQAHTDHLTSLAFSPVEPVLATAGFDHVVRLWDVSDPAHPRSLGDPVIRHTNAVWAVTFTPDGRTLATGGADDTALLWDVIDPANPRRLGEPLTGHLSHVYALAFSDDGRALATGSADRTVRLWDLADPARPELIGDPLTGHTGYVNSVTFASDGRTLMSGSADRTVILWDLAGPPGPQPLGEPLTGRTDYAYSVALAGDGRTLASGGADGAVLLWGSGDGARPQQGRIGPEQAGGVPPVALVPDGRMLATAGADGRISLWDVTDPTRPQQLGPPLGGHEGRVYALAFSPDGEVLASAGDDTTVRLWDVADPATAHAIKKPLTNHTGPVFTVAFAPDGSTLASGGADNAVILWNVVDQDTPRLLGFLTEHTNHVYSVAFATDGRTLAAGGADRTVLLWDLTDRARPQRLGPALTGPDDRVFSVAFAPDRRTLVSGSADGTVRLWDLTARDRPRPLGAPLGGHAGSVNAVALARDGSLAVANGDGSVRRWDLEPLRELRDGPVERACAITGRGLDREEWDRSVSGLPYLDTCAR